MGHHTFDPEGAERLEDAASRYRYLSRDELLGALEPARGDAVVDLGSGTGFYTDDVAPRVGRVLAVDVQEAMHAFYRDKGVPGNVELVTAAVEELPFETEELDGAFSTMTYHEFASPEALHEVARVVTSGGRLVVADWSAEGDGEHGPPLDERYAADEAVALLEAAGFDVVGASTRPETWIVTAESG